MISILALGSDLKPSFTFLRGREIFSESIINFVELSNLDDFNNWSKRIIELCDRFKPNVIVVDKHPLFISRRFGIDLSRKLNAELIEAQHHHAHAFSSIKYFDINDRVLAVIMDGTGFGEDGTIWGCEIFLCETDGKCERLGHLKPVPCPGGDAAILSPWRMAVGWLEESADYDLFKDTVRKEEFEIAKRVCASKFAVLTSSAGRLFDAAASLLGIAVTVKESAQAAVMLENYAISALEIFGCAEEEKHYEIIGNVLDMKPALFKIIQDQKSGVSIKNSALQFHVQLVRGICDLLEDVNNLGIKKVVFGGGCFLNSILRQEFPKRLSKLGYETYLPEPFICTDLALSIGQAEIASKNLELKEI